MIVYYKIIFFNFLKEKYTKKNIFLKIKKINK